MKFPANFELTTDGRGWYRGIRSAEEELRLAMAWLREARRTNFEMAWEQARDHFRAAGYQTRGDDRRRARLYRLGARCLKRMSRAIVR